jgi:hypothetical protein
MYDAWKKYRHCRTIKQSQLDGNAKAYHGDNLPITQLEYQKVLQTPDYFLRTKT